MNPSSFILSSISFFSTFVPLYFSFNVLVLTSIISLSLYFTSFIASLFFYFIVLSHSFFVYGLFYDISDDIASNGRMVEEEFSF